MKHLFCSLSLSTPMDLGYHCNTFYMKGRLTERPVRLLITIIIPANIYVFKLPNCLFARNKKRRGLTQINKSDRPCFW